MKDKKHQLTAKKIPLLAAGTYADGADGGPPDRVRGLYLVVSAKNRGSWIFRYASPTKAVRREMGLGSLDTLGLHEARRAARDHAVTVKEKRRDPLDEKLVAATNPRGAMITLREASERFLEGRSEGWKKKAENSSRKKTPDSASLIKWRQFKKRVLGPYGQLPVDRIDVTVVKAVLDPLWKRKADGGVPDTANRIRGQIKLVLDWAAASDYRKDADGRDLPNPAIWEGRLDKIYVELARLRRVIHRKALPAVELPDFVVAMRKHPRSAGPAEAVELLIYTAVRLANILDMRWRDIDMVERVWNIPAADLKAEENAVEFDFPVPLSRPAMAILERRRPANVAPDAFVFPGRKPGLPYHPSTLWRLLRALGYDDGSITNHGFRSTFNDWADATGKFSQRLIQLALQHEIEPEMRAAMSDAVLRAYRRNKLLDQRRPLMEAFAAFANGQTPANDTEPGDNVVTLRVA